MSITIAERCNRIKPSPTLAVTQKAAQMRAQGIDVIGLGAGEPDFDTPAHIKQAGITAITQGKTKYTAVDGIVELKDAIISKLKRDNQLEYARDEILVSVGAKHSLYNMTQALLNEGDEVIIFAPYWVSYLDMVLLCGGVPKIVSADMDAHFKVTAEQLEAAITPKTKLFILNSPSNPSGMCYTEAELKAMAAVLKKYPHVIIASDDIYEHMQWEGKFINILTTEPSLRDRTIVINGVSKSYAMTGWRIGYAAGPKNVIAAMNKLQSQSTTNACSIAQWASVEALNGPQDSIPMMLEAFKGRHDKLVAGLNAIPGIKAIPAGGTFYCFFNVEGLMKARGITSDVELAEQILNKALVALVPGSAFGLNGYLRASFATSESNLEKALLRLSEF